MSLIATGMAIVALGLWGIVGVGPERFLPTSVLLDQYFAGGSKVIDGPVGAEVTRRVGDGNAELDWVQACKRAKGALSDPGPSVIKQVAALRLLRSRMRHRGVDPLALDAMLAFRADDEDPHLSSLWATIACEHEAIGQAIATRFYWHGTPFTQALFLKDFGSRQEEPQWISEVVTHAAASNDHNVKSALSAIKEARAFMAQMKGLRQLPNSGSPAGHD